jgi:hypothetical protein
MSATSQLAALGTAQALVMQDQSSVLAAAFVVTSGITISVISMIPPGKIPLWASCLIMMAPLVPFAASMLHLPDLIPKLHPIESLYLDGKRRHEAMISRQSKTPAEAVVEYRKRYQREPPAGFEEWVELALKKGLVLVDEFDGMTKAFDPFYQLGPSILKQVLAATPRDLAELVEVNITSSEITWSAGKSGSYFGKSIRNWLSTDPAYMSILPNTTILVNTFDEPKTVMPVDLLVNGTKEGDYKVKVDVISLGREHPWTNVTLSCAASSPARRNITIPPTDRIQFVSNLTESQDICTHRDFEQEYAFLNRPETLRIIHAPLPVWSQAAPSTFQDILFPSPYYEKHWSDYHAETDTHWEDKTPSIYWAGSTTGGRATPDNWRNMQRQRMVLNTMRKTGPHNITLLEQTKGGRKVWKQVAANSTSLQSLLNIFIGNVTQCDEPSCTEMKEAFAEKGDTAMQASQASKYVLDMDGNGFSGRYYRLLRSNSAVVKQTILKEWHDDWLVPWVHFIPLSLDGDEIWEMMRFLGTTGRGDEIGADIARGSTEWAGKVLRRVDTELVVLRLVLEYARLFDRVG